MRLQDKVAIITGGGSGIGLAYCRRFLAEGAKVMVADIGEEQGTKAVDVLGGLGDIAFVRTDIADEASAQASIDATIERFGRVDILLNNAAIYGDYEPRNTSLAYLRQVFDVNVHGQWLMARAASPHMVKQRWGRIINIASIAALRHYAGIPAYQTSKAGVIGLTINMAGDLGEKRIRVNAIAPGQVWTPMTAARMSPERRAVRQKSGFIQDEGTAWDIGWAAVFLASDEAQYITAVCLPVDGGLTARAT